MTGLFIIKGIWTQTDTEGKPCEDIANYKPRREASEETNPADTSFLYFWPPEL